MLENDVEALVATLIAHRYVDRNHDLAKRALTDEAFRQELDRRLSLCGMVLLDNPYAEHIAVALKRKVHQAVFGGDEQWLSNNMGLDKSAIALLVVLWALMILPKRQRQIERVRQDESSSQEQIFTEEKPLPRGKEVATVVNERTLIADFGDKLGKATRVNMNLGLLQRMGFVYRRKGDIHEGPLLDLAMDYNQLADRIMDGCLRDTLTLQNDNEAALAVAETE